MAEGRPYDAAVLDMVMPQVDGLQLARTITADPVLTGLPMIMLTPSMHVDPAVLRSVGIQLWFSKPLRSTDLRGGLVRLLRPRDRPVVEQDRAEETEEPSTDLRPCAARRRWETRPAWCPRRTS